MTSAAQRKLQQKPETTTTPTTGMPTSDEEEEEIPETVRRVKERLEKETGKTYRYRAGKKDLPSVGDLLKDGAPGAQPPTFREKLKMALLFAALFALSLFVYHHAVLTRPSRRKQYKLPRQKLAEASARMKESIVKVDPITAKESDTVDNTNEATTEF